MTDDVIPWPGEQLARLNALAADCERQRAEATRLRWRVVELEADLQRRTDALWAVVRALGDLSLDDAIEWLRGGDDWEPRSGDLDVLAGVLVAVRDAIAPLRPREGQ